METAKNTSSIQYSDGGIEEQIFELLKGASAIDSNTDIGVEYYHNWPIRYHLTSTRANAIRHLDFSGLDVLELGAGMGGLSRFLAENARHLTVVEGTHRRFAALRERLRDCDNWDGCVANYQDFASERKYDVVCFCGVLEYAGRYISHANPFKWAITHGKSFLKPGGVVLILIENKNGIKYFSGISEDHYGKPYYGVCGYPLKNDIRTFSRNEMRSMLADCGLPDIDVHHLWPDYKLTQAVIKNDFLEDSPGICAGIASSYPINDYCGTGNPPAFPLNLAIASLAESGLLGDLSNSYLFLASADASPTKEYMLAKSREKGAMLYSDLRKYNVESDILREENGLIVKKRFVIPAPESVEVGEKTICITSYRPTPCLEGMRVYDILANHLYYGNMNEFHETLTRLIDRVFSLFPGDSPGSIKGMAFDFIPQNAIVAKDGGIEYIDAEFRIEGDIAKSYFLYRIFVTLTTMLSFSPDAGRITPKTLYSTYCGKYGVQSQFDVDRRFEDLVQQALRHQIPPVRKPKRRKYPQLWRFLARFGARFIPFPSWRRSVRDRMRKKS